VNIPIFS